MRALDFVDHLNAFVTLGIKPTYPNTGYGYIQHDAMAAADECSDDRHSSSGDVGVVSGGRTERWLEGPCVAEPFQCAKSRHPGGRAAIRLLDQGDEAFDRARADDGQSRDCRLAGQRAVRREVSDETVDFLCRRSANGHRGVGQRGSLAPDRV